MEIKAYFAGQLDFATKPLLISVFMQLHPVYQSLGELPNCPALPFPLSGLRKYKPDSEDINPTKMDSIKPQFACSK